ncbi:MAG: TolC family protein, partial [Gemmatimonadota bacterium]
RLEVLSGRPDFTVITRYGGRPLGADFFSAFVAVRIPLWAGRKQHVLADAARRDAEAARHALDANQDALAAELERARADARAEGIRLDLLLDRVLPLADEDVAAALREYRTGQADVLRLLTAQDGQYRVRLEAADAAARYLTSVVALEQLTRAETTP